MKRYYLNRRINRAAVFCAELKDVGTTKEDYQAGLWIEINKEQADFYSEHPNASFDEIMDMEMQEVVADEVPVEIRYKNRVEELVREKYTTGTEIRILFNGNTSDEWTQHEQDVAAAKEQAKQELSIINYE